MLGSSRGALALLAAASAAATLAVAPQAGATVTATAADGPAHNFIVLYRQSAVPSDAADNVRAAGGQVVASYGSIGVVIARSGSSGFATAVERDDRVEGAAATDRFATRVDGAEAPETDQQAGDLPNAPATDADTFSPLQWDMRQIHAPEAHAITGGSSSVLVGDIDTGIDFDHPDLAPNIDLADSASCVDGAPVPGRAAQDDNGHGTHTAGTIAAASNGIGIVGVAPNVKIAAIKAGNAAGYFFPEAVICSFVWAGTHHMDVTNNSYFADPFLFNCRNDPVQRAIWKAEQRAIRFAMDQGTTVVSAEGNESEDLSHPTMDVTSPDDATPQEREVTNACVVIPVEIPGVIGVSATGSTGQGTAAGQYPDNLKSFYSSYGISTTDATAPGGDSLFLTPQSVNGEVLSTWPADRPCSRSVKEPPSDPPSPTATYCWLQGTSMASPHAAGVAALIVSRYGDAQSPQNGKLRPGQVESFLQQTADPQACPESLPPRYSSFTGTQSGKPQTCVGGPGHNSWYGAGQIDALNAVTHASGNR